MRKKIIAGNWKMNKTVDDGISLVNRTLQLLEATNYNTLIIFCPSFVSLEKIATAISGKKNIFCAAQNCHFEKDGAFTGEISAAMVKSAGARYVILGHSERRQYFGETDNLLSKKVNAVLGEGLIPIYCCGEVLKVREENNHFALVETQIREGLFHLSKEDFSEVVIAYEPVWAIGTGKVATTDQAQEMHSFIRKLIEEKYGSYIADDITIQYGGSMKPSNAKSLLSQSDVDGGLIGGASLVADEFVEIIKSA
ncbi:MAG: triose-phosphate isomerase [Chitinophagales bacterium]|nr:triose-phosphate isomerase [Chitinophagales bacterium]